MIGAVASMGQNQGSNMIINLFFNTVVNAAFGIGFQINNYVMMFVQSLNQAAIPQIMKSQSSHNTERSLSLIYGIAKIAFFIMLIPVVPLILNMDFVLKAWLKDVPQYTDVFATLLLVGGLIKCLGAGFDSSIQTTGKIRPFQIFYSVAYLMVLPAAYVFFVVGFPVYTIIICTILASVAVLLFQVRYLSRITEFEPMYYLQHTVFPCLAVVVCSLPLLLLKFFITETVVSFLMSSVISLVWILCLIYMIGCTNEERYIVKQSINRILK